MVVHTQTERVHHAQNAIVEFLLVNHPLDCPVCDKGGECPLQDITFGWGLGRSRFIEPKRHFEKPLALSPLIAIDRERCILCYRCVRFSQEIAEDYQLIFTERGAHTFVGTHDGHPYVAPFSGNIIELCPVGALTSQPYRFRARPWDIEGAGGICTLCPSQCNVEFTVRDEKVMRVLARDATGAPAGGGPMGNPDVDDGWLCDKGRFAYQAIHVDERITAAARPRRRRAAPGVVGAGARTSPAGLARHRGAVGALVGGQATNEEGFLLQRLMREGLRVRRHRLAGTARACRPELARALAAPGSAGHRARPRVRPHRARARLRAARRRADPRPADPQGRPPARRPAGASPPRGRARSTRTPAWSCATRPAARPRSWPGSIARWPARRARAIPSRAPGRARRVPARRRRGRRDPVGRAALTRTALARAAAHRRSGSAGRPRRAPACSRSRPAPTGAGCARRACCPASAPATRELSRRARPRSRRRGDRPGRRRRRDHRAVPVPDRPAARPARPRPVGAGAPRAPGWWSRTPAS